MPDSLAIKFIQACGAGKIEDIDRIFSTLSIDEKNELIKFDHHACFHVGAANGHTEVINFIFKYVKSVTDEIPANEAVIPVFLDRKGESFKTALNNKQIKTVERILEEEYLFNFCLDIIAEDPSFIKIIWNSTLRNCIIYLFAQYCSQNISSVQRLLEIIPQSSHHLLLEDAPLKLFTSALCIMNFHPFGRACQNGKLDIIQLLWNLVSNDYQKKVIKDNFASFFILATKNGYIEILKQLATWTESQQLKISLFSSEDFSAFIYAADRGYLEIVQFIWESLFPSLQLEALKASNFAAYRLAAKNQHLHVMAFLEAKIDIKNREKMKSAVNQGVIPSK
jgi:hypothetical protein